VVNLAGLHDISAAKIAPPTTWVLDTVALSSILSAPVYPASLNIIARLNWGYGSTGTLPVPDQYQDFARRFANYVRMSHGCTRWVVGNEPNHPQEWPNGQPIYPAQYAACYKLCRQAVHAIPGHEHDEVLVAGSGPWNAQLKYEGNPNGDWIQYFSDVIGALGNEVDGFSIHSYTHGYNVALVTSSARMDAPFQSRRSEFRAYLDYLEAVPDNLRDRPVYLTESNGNGPWQAVGLMPAMLNEVNNYNIAGKSRIQCVIFYRFSKDDSDNIDGKDDVIKEYLAAVGRGYTSPDALNSLGAKSMPDTTYIPAVSNEPPASAPPQRQIDQRLVQRGTTIIEASVSPGATYFRLVKAQFFDHNEAGGRHHVYVEAFDERGAPLANVRFVYAWSSGKAEIVTNGKSGFDAANQPFSEGRNAFSVFPADGLGDKVEGIGMGQDDLGGWNAGEHTATLLRFQRVVAGAPVPVQPPAPTGPQPPLTTLYVGAVRGVNMRAGPSTGSVVLTAIPYAEAVQVSAAAFSAGDSWLIATYAPPGAQSATGWILATLLSKDKPAPLPVSPTAPPAVVTGGILDPLILEAIVLTESGGSGFQNGRLVIRIEAHLLLSGTYGSPSLLAPYFRYNENNILEAYWRNDPNAPWQPLHASQDSEWAAFTFASRIDAQAAARCTSMGAGQILGINARRVGYANPLAMFNDFGRSEIAQIIATINYCLGDPALVQAINAKDFTRIATLFNGRGNEAVYSALLLANYKKVGGS
jgi:hypothetical protein